MSRAKGPRSLIRCVAPALALALLAPGCGRRSRSGMAAAGLALPASPPVAAGADDLFEDVTAKSGIDFVHQLASGKLTNIMESVGAGGVVFDYDGDGLLDVYLVNSGPDAVISPGPDGTPRLPNRLYRNRGDGKFEDVTQKAGVEGSGYGVMAAAADYDNDGHVDLFVVNVGRSILYRNRGDGTFEDVTKKAGLGQEGTSVAATFLDYDNDGHLDLFLVNYLTYDPSYKLHYGPDGYPGPLAYKAEFNVLYRNRGDGTFEDVSEKAGVRIPNSRGMGVTPFDFNGDGHQDLYVTNDASPNQLLLNDGKGRFRDAGVEMGAAFSQDGEAAASMGAAIVIVNGDLHYLNGWEALLLENDGTGVFKDASQKGGAFFRTKFRGRGATVFDFDNDGRMDILTTNIADRPVLLRNRDTSGNTWIALDLEGTKSNRDGFGAKVTLKAGGRTVRAEARCPTTYRVQGYRRLHFGLGKASKVDSIEIAWPSGQSQRLENVRPGQILKVREPGERRCRPVSYTHLTLPT